MDFEFDDKKSLLNKKKHGIDFLEAQEIFNTDYLEFQARTTGREKRFAALGEYGEKVWVVIFTYRGVGIRIISARLASKNERELYEKEKDNY